MLVPPAIANLTKLCDKDSTRYALGGVKFERDPEGKPVAIATDGRVLAFVSWEEDDCSEYPAAHGDATPVAGFECIVPMDALNEAAKFPPKRTNKPILANMVLNETSANGKVTLSGTDLSKRRSMEVDTLTGKFPKWDEVFPTKGESMSVTLDPKLLKSMCDVLANTIPDDDRRGVTFIVRGPERPVVMSRTTPKGTAMGVIMPLAVDNRRST